MWIERDGLLECYNIMDPLRYENSKVILSIAEPRHLDEQFINRRKNQLQRISSEHFLSIEEVQLFQNNKSILITYKVQPWSPLSTIIQSYQLYPSQIKSIVWQITKIMLQCQRLKINHFRLSPKTIVLAPIELQNQNIKKQGLFLWLKDFSFGSEFLSIKDGKQLQIFQFLHPHISLRNGFKNFQIELYDSRYDIWSLGISLYYILYGKSPFRKSGQSSFSKTILRRFLQGQYSIQYQSGKNASVDELISLCLSEKLPSWLELKEYIIREWQMFSEIDFEERSFVEICGQHIQAMYLFSSVYCMIVEECRVSPHHFWQVGQNGSPFVFMVAESVLVLMHYIHRRFLGLYEGYFHLLKGKNNKCYREIIKIGQSIQAERGHLDGHWLTERYRVNREGPLTNQTVKMIQQHFARVKMQSGITRRRVPNLRFKSGKSVSVTRSSSLAYERVWGWRSIQILYDFCDEMIQILNRSCQKMKRMFELVYRSRVLSELAVQDFGYPAGSSQMSGIELAEESLKRKL